MAQMIADRYELLEQIGAGGMGTVYRGLDSQTGQPVAVKQLKAEISSPEMIERFKREGEALRQLNHPNIVKMLDMVQQQGEHYLILEYVPSGELKNLARRERMATDRLLALALEVADGLTRAHHLKIVHRDLKPANILIAEDGTPRLTDFGVAYFSAKDRVTEAGMAVGTVDYLSPEALQGKEVDQRIDIWAFGVILFELLTGQRPFPGDLVTQVITAILTRPLPDLEALRPDIPVTLIDLIYRMLEKDANRRIPSVRLVSAELEVIRNGIGNRSAAETVSHRELAHRGLPAPTIALSTPSKNRLRNNVPAQTTPFVEREHELDALSSLIRGATSQIVTIVAPGGTGKTRVALELGSRFADESPASAAFPNGILFVPLASLFSAENIPTAIAEAAELPLAGQGSSLQQQLFDYFHEKKLLLILDNFEHVLVSAPLVSEIAQHAPDLKILVTSRERLNLQGESVFRLDGMAFPKRETAPDALGYDAIKLFLQSLRQLTPGFEPTPDALREMVRICRLVDGLPLGIVLAASWIETLSLHEIADEIGRNLDFLESEARDVPTRQRSIRAVFDYSWELLSESEQQSLMRLAVFRGGFTRDAATTAAEASLKTLAALVNKSLLRRDPSTARYEVHELIRQYAEEKLRQSGALDQTRSAHLEFFAGISEAFSFFHFAEKSDLWSQVLEADHDNIRAALTWAIEGGNPVSGLKTAVNVWVFWFRWGYAKEGLDWLIRTLEKTEGVTELRTYAWLGAATLAGNLGDSRSEEYANRAIQYAYQLDLKMPRAMLEYAVKTFRTLDYTEACQLFETALELLDESGLFFRLVVLSMYADRARVHGDLPRATRLYSEVLQHGRALSMAIYVALPTGNLGRLAIRERDYGRAVALLSEAVELSRGGGVGRVDFADMLMHLGTAQMYNGDHAAAEATLTDALSLWQDIGQLIGISHALHLLANVKLHQGVWPQAHELMKTCLARDTQYREPTFSSRLLTTGEFSVVRLLVVGRLATHAGDIEPAVQLLAASGAIAQVLLFQLEPPSQDDFDSTVAALRDSLSPDAFAALWEAGSAMDESSAVQFAADYLNETSTRS